MKIKMKICFTKLLCFRNSTIRRTDKNCSHFLHAVAFPSRRNQAYKIYVYISTCNTAIFIRRKSRICGLRENIYTYRSKEKDINFWICFIATDHSTSLLKKKKIIMKFVFPLQKSIRE